MFNEIKFKAEADRFRKLYTDTQRELKVVEEKNVLLENKVKRIRRKAEVARSCVIIRLPKLER
jgi:hypothetical protein